MLKCENIFQNYFILETCLTTNLGSYQKEWQQALSSLSVYCKAEQEQLSGTKIL